MTCCGCTARCAMSANGLCRACRGAPHSPQISRRLRVKAASRWTEGENEVLLSRYDLSQRQAVDRSVVALLRMEKLFSRALVYANGLDNPYMEEHARKAVMGYIWAAQARPRKPGSGRKPMQLERAVMTMRKAAV
jgi:hypothetical protein